MCALAELLARRGVRVSGCDLKDSRGLRDLEALGVEVCVGHDAAHASEAGALVVTSAVPADHPELLAAHERGIPVLKRAQALGAWVNAGRVVAVAGTHGKTTTTAMTTHVLAEAGLEPTGLVGGRVPAWGGNLHVGHDDLYVVEADEYDRSFLTLSPDVAVVTNLEADHLDIYGDLGGVREGFMSFLRGLRDGGRVLVCGDDPGASSLLAGLNGAGYSYGTGAGSQLRAVDIEVGPRLTTCRVVEEGSRVGALKVSVSGAHNLRNALAAAAVARRLGVEWPAITEAMAGFDGVGRRFERLGEVAGVEVVDDYAHHPTEIRATVEAARAAFPRRRLVLAFQPHLYSRTQDFVEEFGAALASADVTWVADVFPAREAPIPGVTGESVVEAARRSGGTDVRYHAEVESLAEAVAGDLRAGDVLLTLGAGSVETVGAEVLELLRGGPHA